MIAYQVSWIERLKLKILDIKPNLTGKEATEIATGLAQHLKLPVYPEEKR